MHRCMSVVAGLAAVALAVLLVAPSPARAEEASKIFARSCSPCHGKDGQPNAVFLKQGVRSFKDAAWQKSVTDAQLEKTIKDGKKGTMMASFAKQLSEEDIKGLVAYVRSLNPDKK